MKKIISLFSVALALLSTGVEAKEYGLGPIAQSFYADQFLSRSPFGDNHKAVRGFIAGNVYASLQSKFETAKPQLSGTGQSSFAIGIAFSSYLNKQFSEFVATTDLRSVIESKSGGEKELILLADAYYSGNVSEQVFTEAIDALLGDKYAPEIGRRLNASERERLQKIKATLRSEEDVSTLSRTLFEDDLTPELETCFTKFETKMRDTFARRPKK